MSDSEPDLSSLSQMLISWRIDVCSLADLELPEDAFRSRYGLPSSDSCLVARMAVRSPTDGQPATLVIITRKLTVNTTERLTTKEQQHVDILWASTHQVVLSVLTKALLPLLCNSDETPLPVLVREVQQEVLRMALRSKMRAKTQPKLIGNGRAA